MPEVSEIISLNDSTISRQKFRGRNKVRRDRSAAYRRIKSLECDILNLKRVSAKYKKRDYRLPTFENVTKQNMWCFSYWRFSHKTSSAVYNLILFYVFIHLFSLCLCFSFWALKYQIGLTVSFIVESKIEIINLVNFRRLSHLIEDISVEQSTSTVRPNSKQSIRFGPILKSQKWKNR